jgi:hypothetical protein
MSDNEVAEDWVSSLCTLPTTEQPLRLAEFDDLFGSQLRAIERVDPTRLVLVLDQAPRTAEALRDLTRRETECCSFFTFTLTEQDNLIRLEVAVPLAHVDVLQSIAARAARVSGHAQ